MIIANCDTTINLAKNPTGANVSLRLLNEDKDNKELLFVLNDNIADGKMCLGFGILILKT